MLSAAQCVTEKSCKGGNLETPCLEASATAVGEGVHHREGTVSKPAAAGESSVASQPSVSASAALTVLPRSRLQDLGQPCADLSCLLRKRSCEPILVCGPRRSRFCGRFCEGLGEVGEGALCPQGDLRQGFEFLISVALRFRSFRFATMSQSGKGLDWADQWDPHYDDAKPNELEKKSSKTTNKEKMDKAKAAAGVGMQKTKVAATVGAQKLKAGSTASFKWIKEKVQKKP